MLTHGNIESDTVWQGCIRGPRAPDRAQWLCDGLNLDSMPFDHELAGKLRADTRHLSPGDRACPAPGMVRKEGLSPPTGNGPTSASAARSRS